MVGQSVGAHDVLLDNRAQILASAEKAVAALLHVIGHDVDPVQGGHRLLEGDAVLHLADEHLGQELTVAAGWVEEGLGGVGEHLGWEMVEDLPHQRRRGEDFGGRFDSQLVARHTAHVLAVAGVLDDFR